MTIEEKVTEIINDYVRSNGTTSTMNPDQLYNLISSCYSINRGSFLPADYCYNRTNKGIDFKTHPHLFERINDGSYLILGENYPYSGPVYYRHKGEKTDSIFGTWTNGIFISKDEENNIMELRINNLFEEIKKALKVFPVTVSTEGNTVSIHFQELLICGINVEEETYKIFNATTEWTDITTYYCEQDKNGTWYYYLETIDECIGEVQRLVKFEAQKDNKKPLLKTEYTNELRKAVSVEAFEQAYIKFMEQADKNVISKKSQGSKIPYGFNEKPFCNGAHFKAQYGQGAPSAAPYMNWWVVSIYYLPSNGNIIMGIEEGKYEHFQEINIKPIKYSQVGNKTMKVATYYAATKGTINYNELYERFMAVCEEVMRLGLGE